METPQGEMSFLDHLEELRWRVIKAAVAIVACSIPCGIYWRKLFDVVMLYPLRFTDPKPHLIITSPMEAVMLSIKIAITGGILLSVPVVFYQFWRFISPGLYKNEKRMVLPAAIASSLCFLLGVSFCYLSIPYVFKFLTQYAQGRMDAMFKINEYLSFIIKLSLAFGLVFELPVVSFVLTKMGVVTPRFLIQKSKYAIVGIFIVAAILTPPDVVSQTILAVPLLVLYAISIGVSYLARRKQKCPQE